MNLKDLRPCAFCGHGNALHGEPVLSDQILARGQHFYLCAPLGQIVEGFLIVAPYTCRCPKTKRLFRCFAHIQDYELEELNRIIKIIAQFYRNYYGCNMFTQYEQGRAGGGASYDENGRFYHHAHLCHIPANVDLRPSLSAEFASVHLDSIGSIKNVSNGEPYLFLSNINSDGLTQSTIYLPRDNITRRRLEHIRLKDIIAKTLGCPEKWNWRAYPGTDEIDTVRQQFVEFTARQSDLTLRIS